MAIFKCPKRIVRDGVLIAFKGEIMSESEAKRRGIADCCDKPKDDNPTANTQEGINEGSDGVADPEGEGNGPDDDAPNKEIESMTVKELHSYIDEHGGSYDEKDKKADLLKIAQEL